MRISTPLLVAGLVSAIPFLFGQDMVWRSRLPNPPDTRPLLQAACTSGSSLPVPSGCKPCPEFTTDGSGSSPETKGTFDLRSVSFGSFTAPGVEEAMMSFGGCEPHAHAFGGSVLIKKVHGAWEFVEYYRAIHTSACKTYHLKTGRDLLLCEGQGCFMGGECGQAIFVCDLSEEQSDRFPTVIEVHDTSGACRGHAVSGSIENATLRDLPGGGMPMLMISCTAGRTEPRNGGDSCDEVNPREQARTYKLDFLFQPDTNTFVPAPSSRDKVDSFSKFNTIPR